MSMRAPDERSGWLETAWRPLLAAGSAVTLAALGFRQVGARGTDAPTGADWLADAAGVFPRWLDRDAGTWAPLSWLMHEPHAGEAGIKVGLLLANGQWDPRLALVVGIVFQALAWWIALGWLLRELRPAAALAVSGSSLALALSPGALAGITAPGAPLASAVVLASLVSLTASDSRRGRWQAAIAGGVAVALSTAGLAVVGVILLRARRGRLRRAGELVQGGSPWLAWNAALLAAGTVRALVASAEGKSLHDVLSGGGAQLPWILTISVLVALAWGVVRQWRRRPVPADGEEASLRLGLWALAFLGLSPDLSGVWPLLVAVAAALGLHALAQNENRSATGFGVTAGLWTLAVAFGAATVSEATLPREETTRLGQERARESRRALMTGQLESWQETLGLQPAEWARVAPRLSDPRFAPWLPASVREPITLRAAEADPGIGDSAAPLLPALPMGAAVLGSWEAAPAGQGEGARQGEYRSEAFTTTFPLLQFSVAGRFDPPGTALSLLSASGVEARPLQARLDARGRWQRTNIEVPTGSLTVRLSDRSAEDWIAFTPPIELGRGTWLAGKTGDVWPALLGLGGLLLAVGLWAGRPAAVTDLGRAAQAERLRRGLPWGALALSAVVILPSLDPVPGGADASGYLNLAKLLGEGRLTATTRVIPGVELPARAYSPLGFSPRTEDGLAPTYPTGLPLMIAAAQTVLPTDAAVQAVSLAHLVAGIALMYAFARLSGLGHGLAWLGAGLVGLGPIYLFNGIQPVSDVPSLAWVTLAWCCLLKSREREGWAAVAGAALAVAVLLRPTNLLAFPAMLLLLPSLRALVWIGLGALPGALWQLTHAWLTYGQPFATGYGDVSGAFEVRWLALTLPHYATQLTLLVSPLLWLALAGVVWSSVGFRLRVAYAFAALGFLTLYAFYFCTHETWWYLRFLLPVFPAMIALALGAVSRLIETIEARADSEKGRRRWRQVTGWLAVAALALPLAQSVRLDALGPARSHQIYRHVATELARPEARGAVVLAMQASGALFHDTDHVVLRFDQLTLEENTRAVTHAIELGLPVYAVLFGFDRTTAGDRLPEGGWRRERVWESSGVELLRWESPPRAP